MASVRPSRGAKERARAWFQRGFRLNQDDDNMNEDEEDVLDEEMWESDASEDDSQPAQVPPNEQAPRIDDEDDDEDDEDGDEVQDGQQQVHVHNGYNNPCPPLHEHPFRSNRPPGIQLGRLTRNGVMQFTTAVSIFSLFFSDIILDEIRNNTNTYAWLNVLDKPTYGNAQGGWTDVTIQELKAFIGCLIYMGFVDCPTLSRYWSTQTLYNGLWARRFLARDRFMSILAFLHISDPLNEIPREHDKLRKVRNLIDHIKNISVELYQASQQVSVDERMVRSKHRSGFRQFNKDKPCRFGFKLFVLAESSTGYTLNFKVYTGKNSEPIGPNGLAYDAVIGLMEGLLDQGYQVFYDNWYSGVPLADDLFARCTNSCGTIRDNRRGFPQELKNKWHGVQRGNLRYVNGVNKVFLQWQDNKRVSILSTMGSAAGFDYVRRTAKVQGEWRRLIVRRPQIVSLYNMYMGGVDRSDQLISKYNILQRTEKWWKVLFFHLVDVAVVNSYIILQSLREQFPDNPSLQRPACYGQLEFREELCRQLVNIADDESVPRPRCMSPKTDTGPHYPTFLGVRRNCRRCWAVEKKERKSMWGCTSPCCIGKHWCLNEVRNCFMDFHRVTY